MDCRLSMHERQDLQRADGQHCGVEVWTPVHKNHAPAASPRGRERRRVGLGSRGGVRSGWLR